MIQEFCHWWFVNVFDPFGRFVYIENFGWTTLIVSVVAAVLTGLFYKPGDPWQYGRFMEHYGFPALIIFLSGFALPTLVIILMLIMPGIIIIGGGLLLLVGVYLGLKRLREE